MHPAFSVIFLTTLIGAGQGLFLALYAQQVFAWMALAPSVDGTGFYLFGSLLVLGLLAAGLFASFFHLGRPERAWRSAARWRTSWLSREVLALPGFMALVAAYALVWYLQRSSAAVDLTAWAFWLGGVGVLLCLALFVCTGMIYACMRFLQEWATPLTIVNFVLLGSASGWLIASTLASLTAPEILPLLGKLTFFLIGLALLTRVASLVRNARLVPKSTPQSAIGIRHAQIKQTAQGAMGGSFNTREFFHGRAPSTLGVVRIVFLLLTFAVPAVLLGVGLWNASPAVLGSAVLVQYLGLVLERWYFFADARHPQNLYYQAA